MPMLLGRVTYVSADLASAEPREDQRANAPFYRATVTIDADQAQRLDGIALTAGMPAEVLVLAGERTMLSYLTQPLRESLRRAFRDH
jgi:multidrug efflux pump subunit AcrA (membrane-fusion protein)